MKNKLIITIFSLAVIAMMSACKQKPAEKTDQTVNTGNTELVGLTPEDVEALVKAEWDSVPQDLLDKMGVKELKSFKEEVKEAQNDNVQYYFGRGASVELDKEGQPVKISADNENAIVIYITAESVAYGSIAFRSEADYNDFVKKTETINKPSTDEEAVFEFTASGKNTKDDTPGYEKEKWFFVDFTSDK